MNIFFTYIKKLFLKLFSYRPKLLSTITFIPFLYLFGWILAAPLLFIGLDKENLSLVGTIFTFLLFVFSLPKWFSIRWGINNTWSLLGVHKIGKNKKSILYFLNGFFISIILITLILIPIIGMKWGYWIGQLSPDILINAILLTLGVGFAEELIFRGWLVEELKNKFGFKKAILAQASIFSFVHIGFDLPFLEMTSILIGLFFLGIISLFLSIIFSNLPLHKLSAT